MCDSWKTTPDVGRFRNGAVFGRTTLGAGPLTPVSNDVGDLEALTPKQFLLGRSMTAEPFIPDLVTSVGCRKRSKVAQACNQMIWNKWAME